MAAIVNQLNINEDAPGEMLVRWTPTSLVPVNFLGGEELVKICSKSVRLTQSELHSSLILQYTIARAAMVNIHDNAPGRLFVRWTPTSLVPVNFMGGEVIAKVCSKSVCRKQRELQTSSPPQYTTAVAAIVNQLNINKDALGRMFVRWTPTSLVQVNFLGGEELLKICFKSVRRIYPELQTSLPLQNTIAMAAIVNWISMRMLLAGSSYDDRIKLGTSQPPGWRGAAKHLFQERSSNTAWATDQFASLVYYK